MKKRLLAMLLCLATMLSLCTGFASAASSEEEALGEIDIFNGGTKMSYLSINGRVRELIYTYYNYVDSNGRQKEIPAYCCNPNTTGVPQTVAPGESIKYLAQEIGTDPKAVGIVANGYPTRGLAELKLENKEQAYYATKMALWAYILPNWNINNMVVNPSLTGVELTRAQSILRAAKDIYSRGTRWNEVLAPEVTCTPDRDVAYPVTVNGRQYKQQVYTFWSKTWVCDYDVQVAFTMPDDVPDGTRIVNMNNQDITSITTTGTGDGYAGQFKVLYPADSIEGETGSVQLSFRTNVYKYAVFYAVCAEKNEYGELQNYLVDTDPTVEMRLSAYSNYNAPGEDIPDGETGLRIIKLESGSELPLSGALFEVIDPKGRTVGTFASNSNGEIYIPLTLEGNYTVIERKSASFHLLGENTAQNVDVEYGKTATVTFFNEPYGNLRIEKKSDTGMALPGAIITATHIETGKVYTGESNFAGVVTFSRVKPGAYRIEEQAAPSGWKLNETVFTANVVSGETTTVPIVDEELPGLRLIKYDRKNHTAMPNVTFEVWRDGELLGHFKTDEFGEVLITDAEPGTYLAFEYDTGNPAYILNTTPQQVELTAGDGIKELLFFNDLKPGLHLTKVDSNDPSKVIPNAVFEIKAVDGSYGPKEFRSDKNGEIDLSMLPEGAYVVTEKSCDGYVIDEAQRIIQLHPNDDAEFVFTNTVKPSLRIVKLSSDGTPLAGVSFRISYIEDGTRYLDRVTSSTGEIFIDDMDVGVLSIQEMSTVDDHILDLREYHVQLFPGKTSELVVENQKRPNLTIWKFDADDGVTPVPGATFLVKSADGHSIAEVVTGEDGSATVENLLPQVVQIIEKSVPSPYLLDSEPQLATLFPNRDRDVYFYNHKAPVIEILKEDSITHAPLSQVRFQVWYASNHTSTGEFNDLGVFTTDENGRIELTGPANGLRDGWFRVKELEPPKGYSIKDSDTQEAFVPAGKGHTFRFENTPLSAIVVWKYDSVSGASVEGAVFQIKYLGGASGTGGTVIGTYRTGPGGSFTVTGLKRGTYVVEELSSDQDHVVDSAPQTVFISGEDQDVVQVYFGNAPKGSLLVKKVSTKDHSPLSDVEFLVTDSTGAVVGNSNGKFVTDSTGCFLIEGIAPNTTLVVKETRAKEGFLLDDVPQTAVIRAGQTVTLEFRNQPKGNLIIEKWGRNGSKTVPLEGVKFEIKYADGRYVDTADGTLSSNGIYYSDASGKVILSGIAGTVVVTELESVEGYTIDPDSQSQVVTVNPNDTQTLRFYNNAVGGIELIKVSASDRSQRIPNTTFEIRRVNDALVDTITTDRNGRAFLALEDGSYYAVEVEAGKGFLLDDTPIYFEISGGSIVTREVKNKSISQIIIHKIDSRTEEGIYGTKFLLYDANKNPLGEYTSDHEGYVYIEVPDGLSGRMYLRELEAAEGYILDKEYKTVNVKPGKTVEIEWENTAVTGQIQIYKYAAEYNEVTGTPPGTPLKGAVYEISNARSGKVVDYITTDARGVAASKPLPLTRYKIVEVTAPPYWQVSSEVFDVTLEYPGQIIKLSAYDKPSNLGVSITKRGNTEVLAGSQMRYDLTVANTSNVPLENFYWHDRIPTDVARATVLSTGTYSARLNYRILYKTNYQANYQVLASNLLTSNNYSFSLNAIPMQAGEVVTDIYFDFGKVPVGFQSVTGPTLTVNVLGTAVNGYQMVNRADVGGKYQGTWQTANASWVTIIRRYGTTPTLPKTGY